MNLGEVERTPTEVRFIVHTDTDQIIYKFSGHMAKQLGEELFKEGCNLIETTNNT